MAKRVSALLLALLLVTVLGNTAAAAEETGSIRVTIAGGGEVTLYRVGAHKDEGYVLAEEFGGGFIKEEDAHSPYLAQWLAQSALSGTPRVLDADGSAEFSRLEGGLYLLVQTTAGNQKECSLPFLAELPYQGQWHVDARPKTDAQDVPPLTGQTPEPFLAAAGAVLSLAGLLWCLRSKDRFCAGPALQDK